MIDVFASWSRSVDPIWKLNLQAALLAVIVGAVSLVGRRRLTPGWRSMLWMLVFVRLIVPFGPSSSFSLANAINAAFAARSSAVNPVEATRPNHETGSVRVEIPVENRPELPVSDIGMAPESVQTAIVSDPSRWSALEACTAIWSIVAAVLLGRLGWLRIRLSRYLSRLEVIRQREVVQLAKSAACNAKLTRVPRLLWGSPECNPAVCGWLFPVLILPSDSPILGPAQLRAVLLHELRHIRTADTLLTWLPRVLCAAFWFNPLLWYASRKWHEERELSCDEWVLRQIGQDQKRSYLETLVAIATRTSRRPSLELTASIVSSYATLERRIIAMKRFHPPTWTGLVVGLLLTLLAGAVGLTDAAQARNELVADPNSAQVPTTSTDKDTGTPVANQPDVDAAPVTPVAEIEVALQEAGLIAELKTSEGSEARQATNQAAPQPKTLKPKIIFAQHVILWEGTEILTRDQLKQQLTKLRAAQPVKPKVYHSLGFLRDSLGSVSQAEANARANKAVGESLELIGRDQLSFVSFLSRRGSGAVDRIRNEDDLKINPVRSLKGRVTSEWMRGEIIRAALKDAAGKERVEVVVPLGPLPVKGAQVVILPLGEPCVVRLRDGRLREPEEEIWYETNADGTFQADPASLAFDPVLLYGDGKYLALILHETGYRVINGQLAASDATYELLPWRKLKIDTRNLKEDEQVEIWMTPEGAHEKFPELSIGWVGRSDQPVMLKVPRGKGLAAYWSKVNEQWSDAKFRHPIQFTADDGPTEHIPKEITLPAVP
ncbi:MAG TPA: M56 family metallopeptidase [Pirellulales bacterium]|nr:M56 family metallopeptidase [Pirellulales bacterium]